MPEMIKITTRLPGNLHAYLAARATDNARSLNGEILAIIREATRAQPLQVIVREAGGFFLVEGAGEPGGFTSRDEALADAKSIIDKMPVGSAILTDLTAV